MKDLTSYLFETKAMKICPENEPFWYTSGKIGPYYINTQFLYGNEEKSKNLLKFIDEEKDNKITLPKKVRDKVLENYNNDEIYKNVIDELIEYIKTNIDIDEVDYISGGERRDWFFSYIVANKLNKPHITIYKDLNTIITNNDCSTILEFTDLQGSHVLHIADLVTEASSYFRAWIPAIENLNANINWSTVIVDRMQGGSKKLKESNIQSFAMVTVEPSLFEKAFHLNVINESQLELLNDFFKSPDETMKGFLKTHPEFLENALNSDEKTAKRAQLCIDSKFYK